MRVVILTPRETALRDFAEGLQTEGAWVEFYQEPDHVLLMAKDPSLKLVIVDDTVMCPFKPFILALLKANAMLNTAVITGMDEETFHEASEGLGVLGALGAQVCAAEAKALMEKLFVIDPSLLDLQKAQQRMETARHRLHEHCVVCWERHPFGLKADFRVTGKNTVEAQFHCSKSLEGYTNVLHGGIVTSLLDGAMVHCLLARDLEAYTVDMRVRFRQAVDIGQEARIKGEWLRSEGPVHLLQATLTQNGKLCASVRAKFFEGTPGKKNAPLPRTQAVKDLIEQSKRRTNQ